MEKTDNSKAALESNEVKEDISENNVEATVLENGQYRVIQFYQ